MTQQEVSKSKETASIQQTPAADPFAGAAADSSPAQGTATAAKDPNPNPKPEALSQNPLAGASDDPNRVASATGPVGPDSLLDMAKVPQEKRPGDGSQAPADQTQIKQFDGPDGSKIEAAATTGAETGAFGMVLQTGGEIGGGNIAKVLDPPPDPSTVNNALTRERAALLSPIGKKLAGFIDRNPAMWGIIAPGDRINGHMLLLNLNTGEKLRAMDGHVVNEGELYMNLRNLPESVSTGDTIDQILNSTP